LQLVDTAYITAPGKTRISTRHKEDTTDELHVIDLSQTS